MAAKHKTPKQVKLTEEEVEALKQRLQDNALTKKDIKIMMGLISVNEWMQERLSRAKLTIKSLKKLFGFTSESLKQASQETGDVNSADDNNQPNKNPEEKSKQKKNKPKERNWDKNKNHGRLGANDYTGCPLMKVGFTDEALKSGFCPVCAESNDHAKLEYPNPSVLVFLEGSPIVSGTRLELKRAKCSVCEAYFTADIPSEFKDQPKYSYTASSALAIQHYYAGQPFKRIETLQKAQGVPLPDATQYDLMDILYTTVAKPVFDALSLCASNGKALYFDDTPGRIIEQTIKNKKQAVRKDKKSVHATAILSEHQGNRIYLFQTDAQTAGKTFANLMQSRQSTAEFISMSDASANNFPELEESLMAKWIITLCLTHGRRKFYDLVNDSGGDDNCRLVLDIIGKVYCNERHCKHSNLSDEDRLAYHQKHSAPLMRALQVWLNNLLLYKEVEPNSRFGEAITYLLKRWKHLTQFLLVLGAPLDNNICEIAIKVLIRYRNNSRFYKTLYGASIGDAMMSLIHTAVAANINPFDYLNALQLHSSDVQARPEQWLPWNFQDTLVELTLPTDAAIAS